MRLGPKVRIDPRAPGTILALAGDIDRSLDDGVTAGPIDLGALHVRKYVPSAAAIESQGVST